MYQHRRLTTDQALTALETALSQVDHAERDRLDAPARLHLMQRARRLAERVSALACVLTDEANRAQASMRAAGTPLTSFLAVTQARDTKEAAAQVFRARDVTAHDQISSKQHSTGRSPRHRPWRSQEASHNSPTD